MSGFQEFIVFVLGYLGLIGVSRWLFRNELRTVSHQSRVETLEEYNERLRSWSGCKWWSLETPKCTGNTLLNREKCWCFPKPPSGVRPLIR
jgi:hypothetical protein